MLLYSGTILVFMFIICFWGNFFKISGYIQDIHFLRVKIYLWTRWSFSYQIVKKRLSNNIVHQIFFSDIFTAYLQLHGLSQVSSQATFFNDVFFAYFLYDFCMRKLSHVPISPQSTIF